MHVEASMINEERYYLRNPDVVIVSTAELNDHGEPMYGGAGTFWRGALGVMHTLEAAMEHHRRR